MPPAFMNFVMFRKWLAGWPRVVLYVLLAGIAGAMGGFLLLILADDLNLPLDFLYDYSPFFITASALAFMVLSLLVHFWLRRRKFSESIQESPSLPGSAFSGDSFKRSAGRILFALSCVATVIFLFYSFENWRGKRAFRNYKQQLGGKGEILDWKALVPPPVPDDQNLAMSSLFGGILDYERGLSGTIWRNTNGSARLDRLVQITSRSVRTKASHSENLERNDLIDLAAYQEYFLLNTNVTHAATPGTAVKDIPLALTPLDQDLEELKTAAATRPLARFPVHYEELIGCLLPHLARVKALEQYLKIHAVACLEAGRTNEAFTDLKLGLRLADSVREEPFAISHLFRISYLAMNLQIIKEGLVRHSWTAEQLAWIQNQCTGINFVAEAEKHLRGERGFALESIDMVRRGALPAKVFFEDDGYSWIELFLKDTLQKLAPSGWYYQNMVYLSQYYEKMFNSVLDSRTQRVRPESAEKLDNELGRTRRTPFNIIGRQLGASMFGFYVRTARWQAALHHAAIACALERHRLAEGKYPESLEALAPRFLNVLPKDVITGEPYKYVTVVDGNYLLYSVGWNRKDDGGKVAQSDSGAGVDGKKGDWVWSLRPTQPIMMKR
jgi:hypothetical protein